MAVVTVDQVQRHLSNPPWSDDQIAACQLLINKRQAELSRWFGVPIEPTERTDLAVVMASGLVATLMPIHTLYDVDGVTAVNGVPAAPYELRDGAWLYTVEADGGWPAYSTRPFSLVGSPSPRVSVHYLAGWGATDDIVGAIVDKVSATMLNRHDDTVVARQLDAQAPPQLKEEWQETELTMLRSRKRPRGVNRRCG